MDRRVHRVLKPSGTFWLAIGDEYAAELKVACTSTSSAFIMRSWVIWYYTFGVNCTRKFNRSHAHLFHFVKDEKQFTFNAEDPQVRVPSARALVYGDSRANPEGRLPDDTWVLRPQDLPEGFQPMDDTWYYSRVAGTFKERQGFHGCQMPEQLLGRIIRVSSNPGDVVFDPFTGSGTTLAVAKKLGREWIGLRTFRRVRARGNRAAQRDRRRRTARRAGRSDRQCAEHGERTQAGRSHGAVEHSTMRLVEAAGDPRVPTLAGRAKIKRRESARSRPRCASSKLSTPLTRATPSIGCWPIRSCKQRFTRLPRSGPHRQPGGLEPRTTAAPQDRRFPEAWPDQEGPRLRRRARMPTTSPPKSPGG